MAHAVDVALHEMATEATSENRRSFQVDRRPDGERAQRAAVETTVRQTPLTEIESPMPAPSVTRGPRNPRRTLSPRSTISDT
jgi:hypothetical protein